MKNLSYKVNGCLFEVHNRIGCYGREKKYGDELEKVLNERGVPFVREFAVDDTGNVCDFIIDDKIVIELKAKDVTTRDDYYQVQRYLAAAMKELGILVNFRQRYLKPNRMLWVRNKRQ